MNKSNQRSRLTLKMHLQLRKLSPDVPKEMTKNNIYMKHCKDCDYKYIGEFGMIMKQRHSSPIWHENNENKMCFLHSHWGKQRSHNRLGKEKYSGQRQRFWEMKKSRSSIHMCLWQGQFNERWQRNPNWCNLD